MWLCSPDAALDISTSGIIIMGKYNISGADGGGGTATGAGGAGAMGVPDEQRAQQLSLCDIVDNSSANTLSDNYNKYSSTLSPTTDILVACYLLLLGECP